MEQGAKTLGLLPVFLALLSPNKSITDGYLDAFNRCESLKAKTSHKKAHQPNQVVPSVMVFVGCHEGNSTAVKQFRPFGRSHPSLLINPVHNSIPLLVSPTYSSSSVILGMLPLLVTLVSLPVLLLSRGADGTENGASRSSPLAQAMLILERFSRVTGVVRFAPVLLLLEDDEDLLRRITGLAGTSSSGHLGLGAAPMIL